MGNICHAQESPTEHSRIRRPIPAVHNHVTGGSKPMDPKLAASISKFAVRFCNEKDRGSSSVCSPLSAQAVLALTALGCAGATLDELLCAMEFSDDKAIRSSFKILTSTLESVEGVTLRMANRVYVTKNGTLKPAIQKDAVKVFKSGLEQLDFSKSVTAAAAINNWVAEQTAGMIKEIISPGSLDADTELVLINAIYFQGLWQFQFSKEFTKDRKFHVNKATDIKVPMMSTTDKYLCYKHSPILKAQMLQLDYQGGQASLVIVLPDEVEGLGDVMRQLAAGHDMMNEIAELRARPIDVMIPKFKIETEIDLMRVLPKMGIKSIFDKKTSDIRMLTSNERLYVSQAVQRAVIEVDEEGTKAAAATYVRMRYCSADWRPPENKKFIADRPFLFLLIARQIPLFLGVYRGSELAVSAT